MTTTETTTFCGRMIAALDHDDRRTLRPCVKTPGHAGHCHYDAPQAPQDADQLPGYCPPWCESGTEGHRQSLEEGCVAEDASRHLSEDVGGTVRPIAAPLGGMSRSQHGTWQVSIQADHLHVGPQDSRGHVGLPLVRLDLLEWEENHGDHRDHTISLDLDLTSGEARTLARQLLHLADRIDLHI